MNTNLNTNLQQMILDNRNLVHHLIKTLNISRNFIEYEDLVSIGTIGLIKAANSFDLSKNVIFSNYACTCIKNEIFIYYNKNKKHVNDISLEAFTTFTENNHTINLQDRLEHPDSDFVEKILKTETFTELINIILNCLSQTEKIIMLYRLGNISQSDISKILKFSQSYISKVEKKAILKIKETINHQFNYTEIFSMSPLEDYYQITILPKDINNFKKVFSLILKKLKSVTNINFNIKYTKKQIIFQISRQLEAFPFWAQILLEFEKYNIVFANIYS
ncbi:MAG: sigma-70 family RNA polymerase sigma factor [Clostridia bacterium]|nr:sigma-70 family RNA polymerase sigma factor [Clostridium sp.]